MTLHRGPGRRSYYRLAVWVGYWIALFGITHIPVKSLGRIGFHYADKFVHLILYFLLVWLGGRYLMTLGRAPSTLTLLACAGIYGVFAALDEWSQQYVGRSMSLGDWLADAIGIALATLWLIYRRRYYTVPDPNPAVQ